MHKHKSKKVLVLTVGGSHQPVLSSIREHKPDFIWFVCSDGPKGSVSQIEGTGKCIRSRYDLKKPDLPAIPVQAGLSSDQYEVVQVHADDADNSYDRICRLFEEILRQQPPPAVIADYTGGTKTMTAAMLLASVEFSPAVELYMMQGLRTNLSKVSDGSEMAMPAQTSQIRFRHQFRIALSPWDHFGFGEAERSLTAMTRPDSQKLIEVYMQARTASKAFAEWDRFEHKQAAELLQQSGQLFGEWRASISLLIKDGDRQEVARLLDLDLNLQRRAARQQYDDAVGRAYRLLEWTAQWLLRRDHGIETAKVSPEQLPAEFQAGHGRDGLFQPGLMKAWELLGQVGSEQVALFATAQQKVMLGLLESRNNSILAHGFQPVSMTDWNQWHDWLEQHFRPFLIEQAKKVGMRKFPCQLPQSFPEATE